MNTRIALIKLGLSRDLLFNCYFGALARRRSCGQLSSLFKVVFRQSRVRKFSRLQRLVDDFNPEALF